MQAVQHKGAAQLLADQGLLSCLLAMAAWMVAPDGGGTPSAWVAFFATSPTDSLPRQTCLLLQSTSELRTCTCLRSHSTALIELDLFVSIVTMLPWSAHRS